MIEYPLPPSSAVSSLDELEKLWSEAGLRSIECKQIKVSRTFTNFLKLWDLSTKSITLSVVLDDLNQELISDIRSITENQLSESYHCSVTIHSHTNAILGLV